MLRARVLLQPCVATGDCDRDTGAGYGNDVDLSVLSFGVLRAGNCPR